MRFHGCSQLWFTLYFTLYGTFLCYLYLWLYRIIAVFYGEEGGGGVHYLINSENNILHVEGVGGSQQQIIFVLVLIVCIYQITLINFTIFEMHLYILYVFYMHLTCSIDI